ncbi:redox-sensitive transcriptional activator SoxR [Pseudoalteromonas denitrificans]|uniref:Redox-sensitive transcriptional activator SoxR n=1 Tax=Pseudoalteromonas denitrificans DSM 6059 TaxID=1123010 RepID=A0A1I1ERB6_9GAMM|nr:redox-sensitive transcriptional activator SoxR [Pseudoalteromonas denitrificans]SFB89675.1 MerR family transcriptional regulator, redox-sensitive transcriptional activator SoxR [Pseudoalteromonas denitrificans DSM 6059]
MNLEEANLSVGYVAKRCGIKVSTLHFYETKGLIRSWRNQGNQRRYKRDVLRRISVIKAAQKIGITLDSIKQTFADLPNERTPCKGDWANLAKNWQKQLDTRIAYMQKLRDSVTGCIGCGCLSMENCPIYNPEDELANEGSGAVLLDRK